MAEALGILGAISSLVQIIDFTARFTAYTRELVSGTTQQLSETTGIERYARECSALANTIIECKRADANDLVEAEQQLIRIAEDWKTEAEGLLKSLDDLRVTVNKTGWKRLRDGTRNAARFMRKKDGIESQRKRLHEKGAILKTALGMARHVRALTTVDMIYNSLSFKGIRSREENIEQAYPQTYRWAIHDSKHRLRDWLQEDGGIFWITGKAGSGKSTLMKYVSTNLDTAGLLHRWAGKSELFIARYYFWYSGSALQKSTEGLLRTVLCQILQGSVSRAMTAFPQCFASTSIDRRKFDFTDEDMHQAIRRLAQDQNAVFLNKKFCFFIDGLDEYTGNYVHLVKLLEELSSRCDIKICLSSRPWYVFERAYYDRGVPHLRLEDITRPDIELYVHDKIRTSISESTAIFGLPRGDSGYELDELHSLEREICDGSDGVFLWVYLVVNYVVRGIAEGDPISILLRRVRSYPRDLDTFFKELIYDRVDEIYVKQTSQALMLPLIYARDGLAQYRKTSFVDYWLIMQDLDGLQDMNLDFSKAALQKGSPSLEQMKNDTRLFLSRSCKDLLILSRDEYAVTFCTGVEFLHRTVFDFLNTDHMHKILTACTPELFNVPEFLPHMILARLKIMEWCKFDMPD